MELFTSNAGAQFGSIFRLAENVVIASVVLPQELNARTVYSSGI